MSESSYRREHYSSRVFSSPVVIMYMKTAVAAALVAAASAFAPAPAGVAQVMPALKKFGCRSLRMRGGGRRAAACGERVAVEPVSGSSGRAAHAWTASSSRAWAQPGPQKQRLRLGKIVIASSSAGRLLQEGTWGSECSRRGTHTSAAMGTHAGMQDVANVARWCAGAHTDVRVCLSVFLSVAGSPASAALPAT